MNGTRTRIPDEIAVHVLYSQDHTCCVCCEKGKQVQIHHIDEDPSNHAVDNLAVLCLECHDRTQQKGGFGRKLTGPEVRKFRDEWTGRVADRRRRADEMAATRQAGADLSAAPQSSAGQWQQPPDSVVIAYIQTLPEVRRAAYRLARRLWESSVTNDMLQGTYSITDVAEQVWRHLASSFPPMQFGKPPEEYFSEFLASRYRWHLSLSEPYGPGTGGRIARLNAAAGVMQDAENAIFETVGALAPYLEGFKFDEWAKAWTKIPDEQLEEGRAIDPQKPTLYIREVSELLKIQSTCTIVAEFTTGIISRSFPLLGPHVTWHNVHDGRELVLSRLFDVELIGNGAEILAEPRYAWVINFNNCEMIGIRRFKLGHTQSGYCSGGVLRFERCKRVIIEQCDLFGSGTYGLEFVECTEVEIVDTTVRECTFGIVNLRNISQLIFRTCVFRDNSGFELFDMSGIVDKALFERCHFHGNKSQKHLFYFDNITRPVHVYVNECVFEKNQYVELTNQKGFLSLNHNQFSD